MRTSAILIFSLFTGVLVAQTPVNKSYPVAAGQQVSFRFDYPELIRISTWDKNEVSITGTVSINGGEHDDAFELLSSTTGTTLFIENKINNMKTLPHRITVMDGASKITFKDKAAYRKYCEEHGREFKTTSWGVDLDIILEIKVPSGVETKVESVYGFVEVKGFIGPLSVTATYGGVEALIKEQTTGEIIAETGYGQIYTNLEVPFTGGEFRDFHTKVSAKPGKGPKASFESKYGNVYLRKSL
jgi:hypothetical protein